MPGVEPQRLAKLLTGDLDKIVLKALQPEASDRYATVDAFAADIERHRQLRPILARPGPTAPGTGRAGSRHGIGSASPARKARAPQPRSASSSACSTTARQGAAGTKRLLTEYREPSELRLELLNLLGELSEQLDLLLQAGKLLNEATQLTVQLHGEDSVRYAQALMAAAEVKTRTSDFDAALAEETRALKTFEQASPQPVESLAQTISCSATCSTSCSDTTRRGRISRPRSHC